VTFLDFLSAFKSFWGAAATAAAAGPIMMWATKLDPPWPPDDVGKIATIFCAVALILAFVMATRLKERAMFVAAITSLVLGLGLVIVYLSLYSLYVEKDSIEYRVGAASPTVTTFRLVVGTEQLHEVRERLSNLELLQNHQFEPETIWTATSLRNTRISLFVSYVLSFTLLTFGAGLLAPLRSIGPTLRRGAARSPNKVGRG
jgi:hypothetical protein